ncbi:MAG: hypothetical protein E6R04_07710 [Spirochaetes bacterium]|nr:MAG: hypothetical protein E6R04_07710 [Spirochaetota bacterium]
MLQFETGKLVVAKPHKSATCYSANTFGGSVPIPAGSLGVVLKQDERWISVLFACVGLTLWVWHSDLLSMPPDASAEPENIQNDPEDTKTVQGALKSILERLKGI